MNWPTVPLESLGEFRNGLNYSRKNEGTGLRLISVKDFGDRLVPEVASLHEINPAGLSLEKALLHENDIVFVRSNGNKALVGRSMRIDQDYESLSFSAFCIRFRVTAADVDSTFLSYFFRSPNFRESLSSLGKGTNINNLSQPLMRQLRIPVPELEVQRRIVKALSAYDDLIENNRRRMALLEEAARQLYREWFVRLRFPGQEHTRIINGVPEGWERSRIGAVADCVGGGTPSTSNESYWEDGAVTWVTPTDVTRNKHFILLDSEKKITDAGLRNSSAKLVPPHAVLMTSRASVGFFALAGREVCTNQGFISIVAHDEQLAPYLLFHLSERVDEIRSMGSGSTYPEVSRGKFRELEVLLPKHSLVLEFSEQAKAIFGQIRVLKSQNQNLRAARDLLLPRLMSGEIAV